MANLRQRLLDASKKAAQVHQDAGSAARFGDGFSRINPLLLAEEAGVPVMLTERLDKLLGAFLREGRPGIIVNSDRPVGMMHMTCAHELGHYFLDHVIDEEQLETTGHTRGDHGRRFAAVAESIFLELYSAVDCARKVIHSIYKRTRRMPDSTRAMFQRISEGKLGADFPDELKAAFRGATWYARLRQLRDELTHGSVGKARLTPGAGAISYSHAGVRSDGQSLVIDDIFLEFKQLIDGVNVFLGAVFVYLNDQLPRDASAVELCGMFNGSRAYARRITVARKIDFGSGQCMSRTWFDGHPELTCPFSVGCGAYRATPGQL